MREFDIPTPARRDEARRRFAAKELTDAVAGAREADAAARISMSQLYALVSAPSRQLPGDVAAAMLAQPALRAAYRDLLARSTAYHLPAAMAASTEALPQRTGDGCRIRFLASQAEAHQVYLIVELDDSDRTPPGALIFSDEEDFCATLELTNWRDGVAQRIVEANSDILRLARDHKSVAYLK